MKKFSILIKQTRKKLKLTQVEFGKLIWPKDNPALIQGRIAKYETGRAIPPGDVMLRVLDIRSKNEKKRQAV